MQEKYTPEKFEQDKAEFINNFAKIYYSAQEYNSSLDLVCAFDIKNIKFEIFSISRNTHIPQNYFMIFRIKDGFRMDESYDFSDLNKEIYEVLKTLNRKKILDYINNNPYNLYEIDELDNKTISKLLWDIEDVSKEDYDTEEFILALMSQNYFFYNYLVNNLYKGYYLEGNFENPEIDFLVSQIENLTYDDVFNIDIWD